jgi:predicted ABC-type ATPase
MTEEQAKKWANDKKNQQKVIYAITGESPRKDKLAYFMAGIPGAGKTEFAKGLQGSPEGNFVVIEHDKLVEFIDTYSPENYYTYRKAGSRLVTPLFKFCLENGISFIFDGTLSHDNGYKNVKKALDHGFSVIVLYIHQDVVSAWNLTKDRETVKKRGIEKTGFIDTCKKINTNLKKIFTSFANNANFAFWIVQKHGEPGLENATTTLYDYMSSTTKQDVESILNEEYNISELET